MIKNEDGKASIEIVLIFVIVIGLTLIFRDQLMGLINEMIQGIEHRIDTIFIN